jgi:hypothetical protein
MSSAREDQRRGIARQIYNKNSAFELVGTVRNPFNRIVARRLISLSLEDDSDACSPPGNNPFEEAMFRACGIIARRSRTGETYDAFAKRVTKPSFTSKVLDKMVGKVVGATGVVVDAAIPLGSVRTKD